MTIVCSQASLHQLRLIGRVDRADRSPSIPRASKSSIMRFWSGDAPGGITTSQRL